MLRPTALCLALLLSAAPATAGDIPTDNVLFVILDDWGVDWLGLYDEAGLCSGTRNQACSSDADCTAPSTCEATYPTTPTLDQLAAEGLTFRNGWSNPVCSATRAAFMTGRHGIRTGVLGLASGGVQLEADEVTYAEAMLDPIGGSPAGHQPALFGKWHLGGGNNAPNDQGFVRYAGMTGGGVGASYLEWNRTVDGTNGDCSPGSVDCPVESYTTSVIVDDALAWTSTIAAPWVVTLAFNAPHSPYHVPPHDLLTADTLSRLPQVGDETAPEGTTCEREDQEICYLAAIEATDRELGRFLAAQAEPPTVILIGDNGTPETVVRLPFTSGKGSLFEGGVNVPFLIRHADGRSAGLETDALVHVVDVFSTILELTCSEPPVDRVIDGRSLLPLLDDPTQPWADTVFFRGLQGAAARNDRFRLILRVDDEAMTTTEELYDLENDPFEAVDLLAAGDLSDEASAALDELRLAVGGVEGGSGTIPSGADGSGDALHLSRLPGGELRLSWSASCSVEDTDHALYEGALGDFTSHVPAACSTGGAQTFDLTPDTGSRYYLVVPATDAAEGSYGLRSDGSARPASATACRPQLRRDCPWISPCSG
ncbi:MAG: sulfatase-like hydrolase/transferase [Acidobacteriota bacterium]